MIVSSHEIGLEALDSLQEVDSLCLFIAEDERPLRGAAGFLDWRLCGGLSRVLRQRFFTGTAGEQLLFPIDGRVPAQRVFVLGLGKSSRVSAEQLGKVFTQAARMLNKAAVSGVAMELPGAGVLDDSTRLGAFANAFKPEFKGRRVEVLAERPLRTLLQGA